MMNKSFLIDFRIYKFKKAQMALREINRVSKINNKIKYLMINRYKIVTYQMINKIIQIKILRINNKILI